jgi:hypothetical protein
MEDNEKASMRRSNPETGEPVDVSIFLPEGALGTPDLESWAGMLRALTQVLAEEHGLKPEEGALGGKYGYGVEFENEIFMMHPFCWCEQEDCPWCALCLCGYKDGEASKLCMICNDFEKIQAKGGVPELREEAAPNFWHKPSGLRIWWYKWIGRSMVVHNPQGVGVRDVWESCLKSLRGEVTLP